MFYRFFSFQARSIYRHYCLYFTLLIVFQTSVSRWFLTGVWSDSKSPQVSRTLLRILTERNNAVVWMVSTRPLFTSPLVPCSNTLVIVPRALIIIGITATFMFHCLFFFNSLARSTYLSFISLSSNFILPSIGSAKSTIRQEFFVLFLLCFG